MKQLHLSRRAFTLIELLVVIAIIAILAAILFPVFAQAKQAAKKTSDLSNTKQLGLAVLMYNVDSDDVFPVHAFWEGDWAQPEGKLKYWPGRIFPYMKNFDILKSPADSGNAAATFGAATISYVSNSTLWTDAGNKAVGPIQTHNPGWRNVSSPSATAMNKPSETILVAPQLSSDCRWHWAGGNSMAFPMMSIQDSSRDFVTSSFNSGVSLGPNGARLDDSAAKRAVMEGRNGGVSAPFAEKGNFVYVDGHAASVRPSATNPDGVNQPEKNQWDGLRD
jgi:prepilin-type N-terminal cleavage/methylation domain-containing protein/prepilin-type processing-associated H-X9-DG protein